MKDYYSMVQVLRVKMEFVRMDLIVDMQGNLEKFLEMDSILQIMLLCHIATLNYMQIIDICLFVG